MGGLGESSLGPSASSPDVNKPAVGVAAEKLKGLSEKLKESPLGELLGSVDDLKSNEDKLKVVEALRAKKKDKKAEATKRQYELEEASYALAKAGQKVDIKSDGSVSLLLDLDKMPDHYSGDMMSFQDFIPPGVKSFRIKYDLPANDLEDKVVYEELAFRNPTGSDDMGFYYRNEEGEVVPLDMELEGRATIDIAESDLEDLSAKQIEKMMVERAKRLGSKKLKKEVVKGINKVSTDPGVDLLEPSDEADVPDRSFYSPAPERKAKGGGYVPAPAPGPAAVPAPAPDYDDALPALDPPVPKRSPSLAPVLEGDLAVAEKRLESSESPTGQPLYVNFSNNPDLLKKDPVYVTYFHGDGTWTIDRVLGDTEILKHIEALRKAGINAVLVIPECDKSKKMDDRWDFFKDTPSKFEKMAKFLDESLGKTGVFNFISFSGGYRGVAAALKHSSPDVRKRVQAVSMLDSTYADYDDNVGDALIDQAKLYGADVVMYTMRSGKTIGYAESIFTKYKSSPGTGSMDHVRSNKSHRGVNNDFLLAAVSRLGGVEVPYSPAIAKKADVERPEARPVEKSRKIDIVSERGESKDGMQIETIRVGEYKVKLYRNPEGRLLRAVCGTRILSADVLPEAVNLFSRVRPNEDFVRTADPYRPERTIVLRKTAYELLQIARGYARQAGYDISCGSTWRGVGSQKAAFSRSDGSGKMVARPGKSHHHRGGTADMAAVYYRPGSPEHGKKVRSTRENYAILRKCLSKAGFVNYSVEGWHHEVFNPPWVAVMVAVGYLPKDINPDDYIYPRILHDHDLHFEERVA